MDVRIVLLAVLGTVIGFAADRLAARWPSHEIDQDGPDGPLRPAMPRAVDWRSAAVTATGGGAFGALAARWTEPRDLALLAVYFAALTVLMATDLDRRILPDRITLPLIPVAFVLLVAGLDPVLRGTELALLTGLSAAIGAPLALLGTSLLLRGGVGVGDLKLAVSLGLVSGVSRLFAGFIVASAASSIVLIALLVMRRISLRSPIPFGPVLIAGGMIAALLP